MNTKPDFIFAGPSKSGSSWLNAALEQHPEIFMPNIKPVNYFNLKYHLGESWYQSVFDGANDDQVIGDASPGYIMNERTPARVLKDLGDVTVLFTLRNPIDRAFSHWWHDVSGGGLNYDFEDLLFTDQIYEVYIRMGMYVDHIKRWEEHIDEDQINILFFEDFTEDNAAFISEVYELVGANPNFEPSIIGERVNQAQTTGPAVYEKMKRWAMNDAPSWIHQIGSKVHPLLRPVFEDKSAYEKGVDEDLRKELELVYAEPTRELADHVGRDLSHWFKYVDIDASDYRSQIEFSNEHKSAFRHWETQKIISKNFRQRRGKVTTKEL